MNNKFGIKVDPDPTRPMFGLTIIVPKEYSNAPEQQWKTMKADLRTKVLSYGEAIVGVRDYVELVKKNLGPDIGARIEADKKEIK